MKTLFLSIICTFIIGSLAAQNDKKSSGFVVSLGAAANYYYGPTNRNFDEYESNRVNWQVNGLLGITLTRDKNDRRTMLAGFGNYGINNASTMKHIFEDQGFTTGTAPQSSSNNFYQLEGGVLFAEVLRLSTGVGKQVFNEQAIASSGGGIQLKAKTLRYTSSTVGFNFNIASVAIIVNVNFNYGRDYTNTVIIPSTGLMLRF